MSIFVAGAPAVPAPPVTVGFHCSHEQHSPSRALADLRAAERAGFGAGMCSDHFFPFSQAQGHSGFAWSWLGAALEATGLTLGVVTAPGQRYHPAIIAQAAATLAEMYPRRLWVALGTGQALNEHITGDPWPPKSVRRRRLEEVVAIVRALFQGETVTHDGLVRVREARLYSRPAEPPLLVGAAVSAETARWVGGWADALITVSRPAADLRQVVEAFRAGGGEGKPMFLQVKLSYAATDAEAERAAHEQWRSNALPAADFVTDTNLPETFDAAATFVRPEDMHASVRISASPARHLDWLQQDVALGFERLYLHNVNKQQAPFIEAFAGQVLPALTGQLRLDRAAPG
jgi:probable non-F420 flavinoid oxidoreductase